MVFLDYLFEWRFGRFWYEQMQKVDEAGCTLILPQRVFVPLPKSLVRTWSQFSFPHSNPCIVKIMVLKLCYNYWLVQLFNGLVHFFYSSLLYMGFSRVDFPVKKFSIAMKKGYILVSVSPFPIYIVFVDRRSGKFFKIADKCCLLIVQMVFLFYGGRNFLQQSLFFSCLFNFGNYVNRVLKLICGQHFSPYYLCIGIWTLVLPFNSLAMSVLCHGYNLWVSPQFFLSRLDCISVRSLFLSHVFLTEPNLGDRTSLHSESRIFSRNLTDVVVWMVALADSLSGYFNMVTRGRKPTRGKGEQPTSKQHQKRGRKSTQQHLELLVQTFTSDIPNSVRSDINGWETEVLNNLEREDEMASEDMQNVVNDTGRTQGQISLFQQSVRTYWLIKCLLAMAVMSTAETKMESNLADINRNIKEINL